MSQDTAPPARRALAGLPPRTARTSTGVSRLIRSNRDETTDAPRQPEQQPPAATAEAARPPRQDPAPEPTRHTGPALAVPDSQSPEVPKYLQLMRREARMHSRQVSELSDLTRALNEARRRGGRSGVGERITDNTLVRIAVDLLLQDPQRLRGTTEDELRASVGLPPLGEAAREGAR